MYSTLNFSSLNTHNTHKHANMISVTVPGKMRMVSLMVISKEQYLEQCILSESSTIIRSVSMLLKLTYNFEKYPGGNGLRVFWVSWASVTSLLAPKTRFVLFLNKISPLPVMKLDGKYVLKQIRKLLRGRSQFT